MNNAALNNLDTYTDFSGLNALKQQARSDKEAATEAVAKQFESLFVSMMLKSMREANKVFSEGNMLNSNETEFYQQMFDSQLSVTLSEGRGIGIAEMVERQLSKDNVAKGFALEGDEPKSFSLEGYTRKHHPSFFVPPKQVAQTFDVVNKRIDDEAVPTVSSLGNAGQPQEMDFSSPESFVDSLYPMAKTIEQETGISAKMMIAQAALETGWGQHRIQGLDGAESHNLFGIKAQGRWSGNKVEITTTEYRNGIPMKERAEFRAYESYEHSFRDYAAFLKQNDRYQDAFSHVADPKAFAHALQEAGYATDPAYGAKIGSIMDRMQLQRPVMTAELDGGVGGLK